MGAPADCFIKSGVGNDQPGSRIWPGKGEGKAIWLRLFFLQNPKKKCYYITSIGDYWYKLV